MTERFPGFPAEGLKFLRQLKRHNDREWFQPRKEQFEKVLRDPMLALCARLNTEIAKFAPDYVSEPNKAIFRIYRDTRFSADKTPYKTHLAAVFNNRLLPRNYGSGFYLHLETEKVGMGGGIYRPDAAKLKILRAHIAENVAEYSKTIKEARAKKITGEFEGHEVQRVPKGFDPEHPAAELLKCRSLFFFAELPAEAALETTFEKEVVSRFRAISKFVQLLDQPFAGQKPASRAFAFDDAR
jgi:uncharacterized protein (TIGR02453 family)